tara:strand:+ start:49 stop:261 length:213 start_codon:yes stop_codon:yes gene_type:complete
MIVENTKNNFYGIIPLCPTGKILWVKAIASIEVDENIIIRDFIELTQNFKIKNKAFVLPDGRIFAVNKHS